jgi:hypothetical protein
MYTHDVDQSYVVPLDSIVRVVRARTLQKVYAHNNCVVETRLPYLDCILSDHTLCVVDSNLPPSLIVEVVSFEDTAQLVLGSSKKLLPLPQWIDSTTPSTTNYVTHKSGYVPCYPYGLFYGISSNDVSSSASQCEIVLLFADGILSNFSRIGKKQKWILESINGKPHHTTKTFAEFVDFIRSVGELHHLHTTQFGIVLPVWPPTLTIPQLLTNLPSEVGRVTPTQWGFLFSETKNGHSTQDDDTNLL